MGFLKSLMCVLALSFLVSCEKKIEFDLGEKEPKLVVEATIENGQPPVVILTNTFNYFENINAGLLAGAFVRDAVITISNGTLTHQLKEYAIPTGLGSNIYYYSIDSSQMNTAFNGTIGGSYALKIVSGGKEYTAQTTIPEISVAVDSLWWTPAKDKEDSNRVIVRLRATDEPGYGSYGRYFTKRNNEPFYAGLNSAFDDYFIDGTQYELQVEPGFDRNLKREDEDLFFHRGDTVALKLSNIDRATHQFWRTMEFSYASVGNPFSTPIKVLGNISNGALGYFGGYASQIHTLIIPK